MDAERWERIKHVFERAVESAPDDRARLISEACEGDVELVAEVAKLLEEHERMGDFLTSPAVQFAPPLTCGAVIADRYEIESLVGRGGMGEVYRARDRLLQETIALKIVHRGVSFSNLSNLQREINAARKVTHPNVCRVFDVGVHTFPDSERLPLHFLTMEFLQGETLEARIKRGGRISGSEALPVAIQLAEGLGAAHAAGIIHRDFKSGNTILVPTREGLRAVITDFGLARLARLPDSATTATLSSQQVLVGTVGYMSPEQLAGKTLTPASDVYSLGIVLFEMVTGKLPFHDSHLIQAAVERVSGHVPSVRKVVPDLDRLWDEVIGRCFQVDPGSRPPSAAHVANAFRRHSWSIPRPSLSRRQWLVASCGAAAVAPFAWYQWSRPYQPHADAERWYEQGVTHVYETTYDAARKALEQSLRIDPNYAPARAYLALALRELDYPEQAREEVLTALAALERKRHSTEDVLRVKAAQFFVSSNYDLAQPLIDDLVRHAQGARQQQSMIEQGMLAMYRSKLAEAQRIFEKVLAADASDAGAQLRLATVYARQRKNDLALKSFDEAERLFRAANNIDGVTEALFQRGVFLARANRSAEAIPVLEEGMAIAADTADVHHQVRLQLALGMACGSLGQFARAQSQAEAAIQKAASSHMEHAAAIGLLDLGNTFLVRGQLDAADKYFLQGLEYARQTKSQYVEMRASLALGSLRVELGRPQEAIEFIQRALPFYEQGSFLREVVQAYMLLGSAQDQLGEVNRARQTLRKAVAAADRLGDAEQSGNAHGFFAHALMDGGDFSEAIAEEERSVRSFANARGGLLSAFGFASLALIESKAGLFDKSAEALANAESRLAQLEGEQIQLRRAILNARAQIAYFQGKWTEAARCARQEMASSGAESNAYALLVEGLASIRTGQVDTGLNQGYAALRQFQQKQLSFAAAEGTLMLAQAVAEANRPADIARLAKEALAFFEPLENWEAIWRCRKLLGDPKAREALDRCAQILGPELFESYRKRPDFKKMLS